MDKTKNDLSANNVKFDYDALLKTAQVAVYAVRNDINDAMNKLQHELEKPVISPMSYILAQSIESMSSRFTIAIETLHTLQHGKTREIKEFINLED